MQLEAAHSQYYRKKVVQAAHVVWPLTTKCQCDAIMFGNNTKCHTLNGDVFGKTPTHRQTLLNTIYT